LKYRDENNIAVTWSIIRSATKYSANICIHSFHGKRVAKKKKQKLGSQKKIANKAIAFVIYYGAPNLVTDKVYSTTSHCTDQSFEMSWRIPEPSCCLESLAFTPRNTPDEDDFTPCIKLREEQA